MKEIIIKNENNVEQDSKRKLIKKKAQGKKEDLVFKSVVLEKDKTILKKEGNCFALKEEKGFKASFKERLDQGEVLTLNKNDHLLKMNFLGKKSRMRKTINAVGKVEQDKVTYEDVEQGVNLSYQCLDNKIKECVVIKEKQDSYDYDFTMDIGDLTPKFDEKENSLELMNGNEVVYRILSPFMEDQNKQRSEDCSYEIEENNGKLKITLHCDPNWINSEERVFPVVVDPTIEVIDEEAFYMAPIINSKKYFLIEKSAQVGLRREDYGTLGTMPANYQIFLRIGKSTINEYRNSDFIRLILTVEKKPTEYPSNALIYIECQNKTIWYSPMSSIGDRIIVDVTKEIKNIGVFGLELTIGYEGALISGDLLSIYSIYADASLKPKLEIGIKKQRKEETYNCGKIDVTKLNVQNGTYRHIHEEGSIKENSLNLNLKHIYESLNNNLNEIHLGNGWRTNLHQYLIKPIFYNDVLGQSDILYVDGKGRSNIFRERWYYLDKNNERHYVRKKEVFLDTDQKLKTNVAGEVFEIKYEVKNDDGLTFVSGNNISNFNSIRFTDEYSLGIEFADGEFLKVLDSSNWNDGQIEVPSYKEIVSNEERDICYEQINYKTMTSIRGNPVKSVGPYANKIQADEKGFYISNLMFNGGNSPYLVKTYLKYVWNLRDYEDMDGIYINEDIQKLDSEIKNLKLKIKSQYILIKNSIQTIKDTEDQALCQSEIMESDLYKKYIEQFHKYYGEYGWGYKALIKSLETRVDEITYDQKSDVLNLNSEKTFDDINKDFNSSAQINALISDYLQNISNRLNLASENIKAKYTDGKPSLEVKLLEEQVKTYKEQLDNSISLISEDEKQLEILKNQKEILVKKQKKQVNDLIIDQEGNTLGFDGYGRLILIQDKYENKINIEFGYEDENKGKMLSIYSESQAIKFNYDKETGLLSSMIDAQGRKTKYVYDDNQNLIQIKSANGKKTNFEYARGFKVISPSLQSIDVVPSDNQTLKVSTYCLGSTIDESTKIMGNEDVENLEEHLYIFDEVYNQTIIRDKRKNSSDALEAQDEDIVYSFDESGNVIEKKEKDNTSVYFYKENKVVHEATFKTLEEKSILSSLTIYPESHSYHIDLTNFALPVSNLLGIKIDVLTGNVDNDAILDFKVKATVHTTKEDGTLVDEVFEQTYQELKLRTVVLPIAINRNLSYALDIEITSDSPDFNDSYFESIDLIKLEEGKISKYDDKNRLIQEQDGYSTIKYLEFSEKDVPLIKEESNIYGEVVTTTYHYDSKDQLTYVEDSKQNVIECFYDDKGNCIEKRSYNKKDASLMQVEKATYDEHGNMVSSQGRIKDMNGNYPKEEVTYLPGTNIQSKIRGVNRESTCYQYDQNTGDLLSISSSAQGINNSTSFTYNYGLLTSMSHHGVKVDYQYDGQGRKTKVSLNGDVVLENAYDDHFTKNYVDPFTNKIINFNGKHLISDIILNKTPDKVGKLSVERYFDEDDKEALRKYSGNDSCGATKWTYDDKGQVMSVISQMTNGGDTYQEEVINTIDEWDTIIKKEKKVNGVSSVILEDHHDIYHRFISDSDIILSEDEYRLNTLNSYDKDNRLKSIQVREGIVGDNSEDSFLPVAEMSFDYDVLGRVKHQNLNANKVDICHEYSYLQQDENTLDLVAEDITKVKVQNGSQTTYLTETSTYEYDVNGNIIGVEQDENKTRYHYDSLNRLIREDNPLLNKTIVYKYDKAGNILLKKTYDYSLNDNLYSPKVDEYIYDCEKRDRLISFNGKSLDYDYMGRPTTYKDDEYDWNNQNQLTYILNQNGDEIEYFYDTNGIRRKKIVNGVETKFITNGSQILAMRQGNKFMIFRYILNKLVGFNYNDGGSSKEYIYQRNIQGDIIGIFDDNGNFVGGYAYDGYGNHIITQDVDGIAKLNPFRYRGYFFDDETQLYYLNSRYYDPEIGRFISPDTLSILDETRGQINGLNLYMYCKDNPIMYVDPTGHFFWILGIVVISLCVLVLTSDTVQPDYVDNETGKYEKVLSNGKVVSYDIKENESDPNRGYLKVYNSYQYSDAEIDEFLNYLITEEHYTAINFEKVKNEWKWHNFAYSISISQKSTASVDVYFNADDEGHGILSWIINNITCLF